MNDTSQGPSAAEQVREAAYRMSGIELLREMAAGRLPPPPISLTLGFHLAEVAEGFAVFEGEPRPAFGNPLGSIHGGWTATLLDSAMACCVHTLLKTGQTYTTLEFKVHCVRPVLPSSGPVRCEGQVVSSGRTIATSEGRLFDARGKLLAHGTETCLIMDLPSQ